MGIYIIQADGGPIKIGFTSRSPKSRLGSIQAHNHVAVKLVAFIEGGRADEKKLHHRFAKWRLRGEWFEPSEQLLKFIAGLPPMPPAERKRRKIKAREEWKALSEDEVKQATEVWFDKSIPTDLKAAQIIGLNRRTIRLNLGPSGRPGRHLFAGEFAREMQAKGHRNRTKGRMPKREAQIIWRDPRWTGPELEAKMTGWTLRTAYRAFGPRGVPAGPRSVRNKPEEK